MATTGIWSNAAFALLVEIVARREIKAASLWRYPFASGDAATLTGGRGSAPSPFATTGRAVLTRFNQC
jgi:hypothetical protein